MSRNPAGGRDLANIKTMVNDAVAPSPKARTRGVLTLLSGNEVGRVVSVVGGPGVKLGRTEECTVRFDDTSLSRVHATVLCVGGTNFLVKDDGSTNGTFVNDLRVNGASPLRDGDRIQLGMATTLRFALVDETEETALKRVFEAGRRDGLTGIANRKSFDERLELEYAYAVRHATALCLVMIDIDHFKKVNDAHGHPGGDVVLKSVAQTLAKGVRTEDAIARFGGEEFAVILRGIDVTGAVVLADRLRVAVASTPVTFEAATISVTMSGGVSSLECSGKSPDMASLVSIADTRLYKAKQAGRNRIMGPS